MIFGFGLFDFGIVLEYMHEASVAVMFVAGFVLGFCTCTAVVGLSYMYLSKGEHWLGEPSSEDVDQKVIESMIRAGVGDPDRN